MFLSRSLSLRFSLHHHSTLAPPWLHLLSQLQTKNHFTFPLFKIKSQCLSPQSTRHHSLYSLSTPNPNSQCPAVASPPTSQVLKKPAFLSSENPQNLLFLAEPPYTGNFTLLSTPDIHKKVLFFSLCISFLHFLHFFVCFFLPKITDVLKKQKKIQMNFCVERKFVPVW